MGATQKTVLEASGREVVITNPDKVFFPQAGHTKLDLARYYLAVAEGALRGIAGRPIVLKRYVDGAAGEPFFQKRAPAQHPEWVETVDLRFPSGRTAREIVVRDAAQLLLEHDARLLPHGHRRSAVAAVAAPLCHADGRDEAGSSTGSAARRSVTSTMSSGSASQMP